MVDKWEIYFCNLDPTVGSEQKGVRPVLIISTNAVNHNLPVSTVLPLSSVRPDEKIYPTEILLDTCVTGLPKLSVAGRSIHKRYFQNYPNRYPRKKQSLLKCGWQKPHDQLCDDDLQPYSF